MIIVCMLKAYDAFAAQLLWIAAELLIETLFGWMEKLIERFHLFIKTMGKNFIYVILLNF